jgi:predicted nuclease of predicted toxin-antitoxin system
MHRIRGGSHPRGDRRAPGVKFKIDENLPEELAHLLRNADWDSATVVEQDLGGVQDPPLARVCSSEGRILVTFDRGFANIEIYSDFGLPGVVVFRLKRQDKPHVLRVSNQLVQQLKRRELQGELWIVHENRIRIRLLAKGNNDDR